jgi:hypothetical protein
VERVTSKRGPSTEVKPGAEFEEWQDEPDRAKSSEARPAIGGSITSQTYEETEIQKAIAWFRSYLVSERESYFTVGQPLHGEWRESMDGFFEAALLDQVRVVELAHRRVTNPWFYPAAREKGVRHLPDITHKATVTFLDVVVFNGKITSRDMFHGLVHAAQVKVLGVTEFTELFVRGFLARKVLLPRAPEGPGIWFRCEIRGEPQNTFFSGRRNPRLAAGLPILKAKKELLDKSGNSEDKGVNGSPSQFIQE